MNPAINFNYRNGLLKEVSVHRHERVEAKDNVNGHISLTFKTEDPSFDSHVHVYLSEETIGPLVTQLVELLTLELAVSLLSDLTGRISERCEVEGWILKPIMAPTAVTVKEKEGSWTEQEVLAHPTRRPRWV